MDAPELLRPKLFLRYVCLTGVGFVIAVGGLLRYCYPFSVVLIVQFRPTYTCMNYVVFTIGDAAPHYSL